MLNDQYGSEFEIVYSTMSLVIGLTEMLWQMHELPLSASSTVAVPTKKSVRAERYAQRCIVVVKP